MGNLTTSQSESVINALKNDNVQKLQTLFTTSAVPVNTEITDGRTAIILCAIYDSQQCLTFLIENGNDINNLYSAILPTDCICVEPSISL